MTLETMKASADDLRAQGLVDTIVHDADDPYTTAHELRMAIIDGYNRQQGLSPRRLRQKADDRLRPRTLGRLATEEPAALGGGACTCAWGCGCALGASAPRRSVRCASAGA